MGSLNEVENSISFAEFQERALYGPNGFYTSGPRSGRTRDFITSPGLGNVFGEVIANYLDRLWMELDRPPFFNVVEVGAGDGALARSIMNSNCDCRLAIRYTVVDKFVIEVEGTRYCATLPDDVEHAAVIANELFDNIPVLLFEYSGTEWLEVRIAQDTEVLAPVQAPEFSQVLSSLVPHPLPGARVPLQYELRKWIDGLATIAHGQLLAFDYASTTAEMAQQKQSQWLRTYRGQFPGVDPLTDEGSQDITCEVAADQLLAAFTDIECVSQAEFLKQNGIDALREITKGPAGELNLESLRSRAKTQEIDALVDPNGLGRFTVFTRRW